MIRLIAFAAFALALATSAQAMSPVPLHQPDGMITQVAFWCGPKRSVLSSVGVPVLIPLTANVPCAPHRAPADLAFGGSGDADPVDSYPTSTACFTDLRDHAVRLMKRHR